MYPYDIWRSVTRIQQPLNIIIYIAHMFHKNPQKQNHQYSLELYMQIAQQPTHQQLIDENRQFHRKAIELAGKALGPVNKNYYIITIIGVQNSGKSTLMNYLFGTNFSVLHEAAGTRTTRGIWVSYDKQSKFIVFDVEGNDSMDRAEEQDYQKMVATFALIVANVLIINIWSKSLGQYMGSQYETLKVIMDICILQFKQQSPKTILFCVRDFNDMYQDQYEIRSKIRKDVNNIWKKIEKPLQMLEYNDQPQKFFNLQICILRKYQQNKKQKFAEDVMKLKQKFTNDKTQGYLFNKQKNIYNLPINDLPILIEQSWNDIKINKKLNLPKQKDQIASFRCSSVLSEIQSQLSTQLQVISKQNTACDFSKIIQKYIDNFHNQTYHYSKHIYEQKRQQLINTINDLFGKLALQKINDEIKMLVDGFNTMQFYQEEITTLDAQMKEAKEKKTVALSDFMKSLHFDMVDQENYRKQRMDELQKQLTQIIQKKKQDKVKMVEQNFLKQSSREIRLLASSLIKNYFGYQFWKEAKKEILIKSKEIIDQYSKSYKWVTGRELNINEYGKKQQQIMESEKQTIKSELNGTFQDKIIEQFKQKFWKDQSGQAINFNLKTQQQINQDFDKTRKQIQQLISRMNQFNDAPRRSSFIQDEKQENSLFQSTWLSNVTQKIDKIMISQFEKTMRQKRQSSMNQVPWWMFILIFFFVYDDIWFSEEENPVIHYSLLGIAATLGIFVAIGQTNILKEGFNIVMNMLKDRFAFLR